MNPYPASISEDLRPSCAKERSKAAVVTDANADTAPAPGFRRDGELDADLRLGGERIVLGAIHPQTHHERGLVLLGETVGGDLCEGRKKVGHRLQESHLRAGNDQGEIPLEAFRGLIQEYIDAHEIRTLVVMEKEIGASGALPLPPALELVAGRLLETGEHPTGPCDAVLNRLDKRLQSQQGLGVVGHGKGRGRSIYCNIMKSSNAKFDDLVLRQTLQENGHRYTDQRAAVFKHVARSRVHPTAEDVFLDVRTEVPGISLATVYKSLEMLVNCGLAKKLNLDDGSARFCGRTEPHHHARCLACGALSDVPGELGDSEVAALRLQAKTFH